MKLIHLSDLHLGKRVNGFSMIEDQNYILKQILEIIKDQQPDGILIAGDIYDKSIPSAEAVRVFDDFLVNLVQQELNVCMISGNHDSPERLTFASRILESSRIHMAPVYDGKIKKVHFTDQWGSVDIFMLPFIKPAQVRQVFPEKEIITYTDAVRTALSAAEQDEQNRKVLVTHQFVTGSSRCESEELSAGGTDNVDAQVFQDFDYVALGHLHGPQSAGKETVRYCGTPLKYSFSEVSHKKSVTVIELKEKGNVQIETVPLIPLHDMKKLRGSYMELTDRSFYQQMDTQDYYHITLTDEEDIPDAIGKLRSVYPGIMQLQYDNRRTRESVQLTALKEIEKKTPFQLFSDFYRLQNNQDMTPEQAAFMEKLIWDVWEEKNI